MFSLVSLNYEIAVAGAGEQYRLGQLAANLKFG